MQEGSCLRYPEPIPPQREITYEAALMMLLKATATSQTVPFAWGYVDKPSDGTVLLLYLPPNSPYPNDGIRWQDNEIKVIIPAGPRELEVCELKFGFVPSSGENTASRLRRRYRLLKGGNPQLVLIHYTRGQGMMVPPAMANQPVRVYPLRVINEPAVYVAGEKQGQKVFAGPGGQGMGMGMGMGGGGQGMSMAGGAQGMGMGMGMAQGMGGQGMGMGMGGGAGPSGMGMGGVSVHSAAAGILGQGGQGGGPGPAGGGGMPGAGGGGPPTMVPSVGGTLGSGLGGIGGGLPGGLPGAGGGGGGGGGGMPGAGGNMSGGGVGGPTSSSSGMNLGMNMANMSIHQQQALLAQQNNHMEALERRRERERSAAAAATQQGPRPHLRPQDEDDSGDEIDQISTRTIALARYKRNHDWMNQVFYHAAFGKMSLNENNASDTNTNSTNKGATDGGGAQSKPKPAYSVFTKPELDTNITSLQAEIESLQTQSAERRAEKIRVAQHHHSDATMSAVADGIVVV